MLHIYLIIMHIFISFCKFPKVTIANPIRYEMLTFTYNASYVGLKMISNFYKRSQDWTSFFCRSGNSKFSLFILFCPGVEMSNYQLST